MFQFRLRTLLIVVFLVALYCSAVATLGNVVLGCAIGVPIGLVVGVIVGLIMGNPRRGMAGGVAGTLFVNGSLALWAAALALLSDEPGAANPPTTGLFEFFLVSSLVGAVPGAIVGVRVRRGIRASVNTGAFSAAGTCGVIVAAEWAVVALSGSQFGSVHAVFLLLLLLVVLLVSLEIGALFGALYWLFDECVRKHQGRMERRSSSPSPGNKS